MKIITNNAESKQIEKLNHVYLLARHMQFPAKVQKSYAVYKTIILARLVQKCFKTSILYKGKPSKNCVPCIKIDNSHYLITGKV